MSETKLTIKKVLYSGVFLRELKLFALENNDRLEVSRHILDSWVFMNAFIVFNTEFEEIKDLSIIGPSKY
jgi:hypothetical protein